MKYNCTFNLKSITQEIRDSLANWLSQNVSSNILYQKFTSGIDNQSYYLLSGNLNFDLEENRDIVYNYIVQYKNTNNELLTGGISKHTCGHDEGTPCEDFINGGDIIG